MNPSPIKFNKNDFFWKYIRFLLSWGMLYTNSEIRKYMRPIYTMFALFGSFLTVFGLLVRLLKDINEILAILEQVIYIAHTVLFFCILFVLWRVNEKNFINIMNDIYTDLYIYSNDRDKIYKPQRDKTLHGILFLIGIVLCVPVLGFVAMPLLVTFFNENQTKDFTKYLVVPSWYPYKIDNLLKFYLTYIFQALTITPGVLASAAHGVISIYVLKFIQRQVKTIKTALSNIEKTAYDQVKHLQKKLTEEKCKVLLEDVLIDLLQECVQHHRTLIKFVNYIVESYTPILFIFAIYEVTNVTCTIYLLVNDEFFVPKITERVTVGIACLLSFFVACHIAQNLHDVNDDFRNELFKLNWYKYSVKFRNYFSLLISVTNWKPAIRFTPMKCMSHELYFSISKMSFTYLNFLLTQN